MSNYNLMIICFLLIIWLVRCTTSRRSKSKMTQRFDYRTGEAIAVDELIQKYEKEHQQFHERETENGNIFKWSDLDTKDLSEYCRKYLQNIVPTRMNENTIGNKVDAILHYGKGNTSAISAIVVVRCKVMSKSHPKYISFTRTTEVNCVYALKCTRNQAGFIFNIINKYCDFEDKEIIKSLPKRKRAELIKNIHFGTGQPIANDQYLLEYELEHQELLKTEGENGKYINWAHAIQSSNLNSYCYQYISACAPGRYIENITGSWEIQRLHYQHLKTNEDIAVTTIKCLLPNACKRNYYVTRAPASNCVYALLRMGHYVHFPFVIVFKHCNFEDLNIEKIISLNHGILDKNLVSKTEVKGEMFGTLETLQHFPTE